MAAAAHRAAAFDAGEFLMDYLKTRAPFWKRETLSDGERFWVRQSDEDASKTEQWDNAPAKTTP